MKKSMKNIFILTLLSMLLLPAFGEKSKPRVGVLDFKANNISKSDANAIGDIFTSELVISGYYDVIDRKNIASLLKEAEFQISDCTDSTCAIQVGKMLSLQYMIYGSVSKLGNSYVITVYMINVETAQITGSAKERFGTIEASYDIMKVVISKLIEGKSYADTKKNQPITIRKINLNKKAVGADKIFLEVGIGGVFSDMENGAELELAPIYMLSDSLGTGGGIMLGVGEDRFHFGLNIKLYHRFNNYFGMSIGLRGLPTDINGFFGPAVGIYLGHYYGRIGIQIFQGSAINIDLGYLIYF